MDVMWARKYIDIFFQKCISNIHGTCAWNRRSDKISCERVSDGYIVFTQLPLVFNSCEWANTVDLYLLSRILQYFMIHLVSGFLHVSLFCDTRDAICDLSSNIGMHVWPVRPSCQSSDCVSNAIMSSCW